MKKASATSSEKTTPSHKAPSVSSGAVREFVESIVIAFLLAFLFRTFEAEAFVIPTGSMAPTLLGQHKDALCPYCAFSFPVGDSDPTAQEDGPSPDLSSDEREITVGICPNCFMMLDLKETASGKGDRILVSKFAYEMGDPRRWEVSVFKYPHIAKQNFIKRVVGLPNETLRIYQGDIYVQPNSTPDSEEEIAPRMVEGYPWNDFVIQRKSSEKALAMLQIVHDNDHQPVELLNNGLPPRWQMENLDPTIKDNWSVLDETKQSSPGFEISGKNTSLQWLRYRHYIPMESLQENLFSGPLTDEERDSIRPSLITDFYGYNTGKFSFSSLLDCWVGDLAVSGEVTIESSQGDFLLELVEGGRLFHCRFDLATGQAVLKISEEPEFQPKASTNLKGPGTHTFLFANLDDQLYLWVDGKAIEFDTATTYPALQNGIPQRTDLSPIGIAAQNARVSVQHIRVLRDVYYQAIRENPNYYNGDVHYSKVDFTLPDTWSSFQNLQGVEFVLKKDQFLVLGDNSPQSLDSRYWSEGHYVDRRYLIGKAVMVYWPHSLNRIPSTQIPFPFFPNYTRMKRVR